MSESNCPAPAEKPSRSARASKTTRPSRDEQRPGLEEVAAGARAARRAARSALAVASTFTQARRRRTARRPARARRAPADPDLAQRPVRVAQKNPPTIASCDAVLAAPVVEARAAARKCDRADARVRAVADGVDRRLLAVGERWRRRIYLLVSATGSSKHSPWSGPPVYTGTCATCPCCGARRASCWPAAGARGGHARVRALPEIVGERAFSERLVSSLDPNHRGRARSSHGTRSTCWLDASRGDLLAARPVASVAPAVLVATPPVPARCGPHRRARASRWVDGDTSLVVDLGGTGLLVHDALRAVSPAVAAARARRRPAAPGRARPARSRSRRGARSDRPLGVVVASVPRCAVRRCGGVAVTAPAGAAVSVTWARRSQRAARSFAAAPIQLGGGPPRQSPRETGSATPSPARAARPVRRPPHLRASSPRGPLVIAAFAAGMPEPGPGSRPGARGSPHSAATARAASLRPGRGTLSWHLTTAHRDRRRGRWRSRLRRPLRSSPRPQLGAAHGRREARDGLLARRRARDGRSRRAPRGAADRARRPAAAAAGRSGASARRLQRLRRALRPPARRGRASPATHNSYAAAAAAGLALPQPALSASRASSRRHPRAPDRHPLRRARPPTGACGPICRAEGSVRNKVGASSAPAALRIADRLAGARRRRDLGGRAARRTSVTRCASSGPSRSHEQLGVFRPLPDRAPARGARRCSSSPTCRSRRSSARSSAPACSRIRRHAAARRAAADARRR